MSKVRLVSLYVCVYEKMKMKLKLLLESLITLLILKSNCSLKFIHFKCKKSEESKDKERK